jgi:hypothetical protein
MKDFILREFVESSNHDNYFYVRKFGDIQTLELPFDNKSIKLNEGTINNYSLYSQKHLDKVSHRKEYYLTNILTDECICYVWNEPFQDVCKHVHAAIAARLFCNANLHSDKELFSRQIKEGLVTYFK